MNSSLYYANFHHKLPVVSKGGLIASIYEFSFSGAPKLYLVSNGLLYCPKSMIYLGSIFPELVTWYSVSYSVP